MGSTLSGVDHSLPVVGTLPDELNEELIAFRRDLHMHPELSREEYRTTAAIRARLEKAGLQPREMPGGTGLICDIDPADAGPRIALRADIDALPIPDTKIVEYRSTVHGAAHACGHDVHTTVVLGAEVTATARVVVAAGAAAGFGSTIVGLGMK